MTLKIEFTDFVLMFCFSVGELFYTGSFFFTYPFIALVFLAVFWINKRDAKVTETLDVIDEIEDEVDDDVEDEDDSEFDYEADDEDGYHNTNQTDKWVYEPIDILQAPRLENNPFAYAYINNPFCGNGCFDMNSDETEKWVYEPIDILQAPRLEKNPFAYAYINNPFCGNDFPPLEISI
ncbi:hypothetical protein NPIL_475161 [Nephila pilipes]|uniref:Transmembrane protein n=1 Tax=Nephila pilipes TaxID=299642 RepID=A0A8X6IVZ3_NEPPI|nr:hypothetical protein NPIL_475161 [Nephila pilipes]